MVKILNPDEPSTLIISSEEKFHKDQRAALYRDKELFMKRKKVIMHDLRVEIKALKDKLLQERRKKFNPAIQSYKQYVESNKWFAKEHGWKIKVGD